MVKLTAFSCKVVSSFVCWIRALGITQAKPKNSSPNRNSYY